ncbi:ABC transporter substrate-binding protein [Neorhizobium galegae]|uniref:ABC transporter substrate-binding protein n=2 Tax=Neorhizobium galegae TaxID=399 RepID=A0A6A1TJ18_NEOGA|nr:ABC transporter substrate-binding protein [Neorhizobium galegae]KAB1083894.1 ABC transporter substrate-binding protein [Neorhizobium galegae]MCQ1851949.1 ABC transporter substrate-binding protein [Neorhizobium galegae]CDN52253.1 Putative dibenzothiophene desulfurization enzyme B [Neorhizobium galegae bv. orientalis str. HAMBI 540]CDZ43437.1 Putative dibenzothiophene desulfurization enzyme B [Neorhizobium galegae bv. orientalis]
MPSLSSVWYTRCPAPTPLSIAHQLGWIDRQFESSAVVVRSIRDSKDPVVRQSHFTHALDYSFRQGGNIPPIWARSGGRETRVIGITSTDEFQAIIALPSSGIKTGAELKGRRLGVPRKPGEKIVDFQRATALKGIVSALSLDNLTHDDVELVYLDSTEANLIERGNAAFLGLKRRYPYGDELLALARGDIDAFFVKGAEGVVLANQIGAVVVSEFGFHPDAKIRINNGTPRPLTVDARFLDEHFDLVTDLVQTIGRVAAWAEANPDNAVRLIANEIGVGEDAIWAANGSHVHKHLTLSLDADQIAAFDHFKSFLLEWGFIPADFNVSAWIDSRPLEAASRRAAA